MAATSRLLLLLLLALLGAVKTPLPGSCEDDTAGGSLIQCYDPPLTTNGTAAFRASLRRLLGELPSAAAPTGFASLRSSTTTGTSASAAFVRGLCFGSTAPPPECRRCLSVAARTLASGCGATARRAGLWSDRCFAAYADTDASSPREDAFRSRLLLRPGHTPAPDADVAYYYGDLYLHAEIVATARFVARGAAANVSGAPRMLATADATAGWTLNITVHVLAQCAPDRAAAECVRCLQDSAGTVDWELNADRDGGGVAAAVVGFNCYLEFQVSTVPLPQQTDSDDAFLVTMAIIFAAAFVPCVLAFAICCGHLEDKEEKTKDQEQKTIAKAAAAAGESTE